MPLFWRVPSSWSNCLICSSMFLDHSHMLSDMFSQFGTSLMIWFMTLWKYSPDGHAPMIRRVKRCGPSSGVWKAVMCRDSLASVTCRYPCDKSTSEKIVAPSIFCKISSTVGICTRRRVSAWFGTRISSTRQTSRLFLGMAISGESQGVDPSTFSIMPC